MPLNERKVINIILNEAKGLDERCKGYREALIDAIADIMAAERQHRTQGTNIQKRVSDKCNAVGQFLAEQQRKAAKR